MAVLEGKTTNVIYVGTKRRRIVEKAAIQLSAHTGCTISAAKLTQDFIDKYLDTYVTEFLETTPADND